jgi:hypothetical protein
MRSTSIAPRGIILTALALLAILSFAALVACGGDDDDGGNGEGDSATAEGTADGSGDATDDGSNGDDGGDGGSDDGNGDGGTDGDGSDGDNGGSGSDGNGDAGDDGDIETFERLEATIGPVEDGPAVGGTAQLVPVGAGTQVTIQIADGLPGGSHAAMLHLGSCSNIGEVQVYLAELVGPGSADSTTVVPSGAERTPPLPPAGQYTPAPTAFVQFIAQDHVLVVHEGPTTNPGAAIACGLVVEP